MLLNSLVAYTNLSAKEEPSYTIKQQTKKKKYFAQNRDFKFTYCFRILWYYKSAEVENTIKCAEWKSSTALQECRFHVKESRTSKQEVSE